MSYDNKRINDICDEHVEEILNKLGYEYVYDNGWIATPCIFHGGTKNNLKYRNGRWYCFSECRCSYTMIDFLCKALDASYIEVIKWVKHEFDLNDEHIENNDERVETRKKIALIKRLTRNGGNATYSKIDQSILNDVLDIHHEYILSQGFKDETLTHFGVGFDLFGGLSGRVCFPIDAPNGDIISVSGRTIEPVTDDNPKYKILGHTKVKDTLYNISRIDKSLGYVIVVEGFKDVMYLYQEGYQNVVATIGAGASEAQERLLKQLGVIVIAIGDNDEAGRNASQKLYNRMHKHSSVYRIDLAKYTNTEKDSICDLEFDNWIDLDEKLQEIINERG